MGHNHATTPSAGWWVLTTANAAGTNGLTCLAKDGGARNNTFLVTLPMTEQHCLTSAIVRRSALITEPSSSSIYIPCNLVYAGNFISQSNVTFIYIMLSSYVRVGIVISQDYAWRIITSIL
jgi:hypothetical protein